MKIKTRGGTSIEAGNYFLYSVTKKSSHLKIICYQKIICNQKIFFLIFFKGMKASAAQFDNITMDPKIENRIIFLTGNFFKFS